MKRFLPVLPFLPAFLFGAAVIALVVAYTTTKQTALADVQDNLTGVATITNSTAGPGTTSIIGTRNTAANGVMCTFNQTANVGTPSTVIYVDGEDSVSGAWQNLAASGAVTTNVSASVEVYPGAVATSVPSGLAVAGLKLPAIWRLRQIITGGTSSTSTASCDLLR
jgi:hypothetical protein